MTNPDINLEELKALEAKADPEPWYSYFTKRDSVALTMALRNNAKELIRLAEIGKRAEDSDFTFKKHLYGECDPERCQHCSNGHTWNRGRCAAPFFDKRAKPTGKQTEEAGDGHHK